VAARVFAQAVVVGALVVSMTTPALAAGPGHGGGGGGGGGGGTGSSLAGNDVSYPQCGAALPSATAFAIVGVNGGLANDLNPCLGPSSSYPSYGQSELYWATEHSTGATTQPRVSLYVNTADPGNEYNGVAIADWPTDNSGGGTDPYGTCATVTITTNSGTATAGANSTACAWQYGYNMATQDASWLTSAADAINGLESGVTIASAPGSYRWWLDVETANSWQTGTSGVAMNLAVLEGMADVLASPAYGVGAYSTSSQWDQITGGTPATSPLYGTSDWVPGARTQSGAISNCAQSSFTGGTVMLTQWTSHSLDYDHAC
jgi:hypothetical protein